ncbi:diadenylate cyclase CdaA [Streptococcus sp. E29BA]|uniref:diadenylate cyclase CdaA n=1 Tax=Streptococcus sp. E29BA TaxID=3278716 RepID=UPI00359D2773
MKQQKMDGGNGLIDQQLLESLFASPWEIIINLVDLFLVTWLIYRFIRALAGTKIMSLVQGVGLFILLRFVAELLDLTTITYLMNQVTTYGVIAGVVIFAPEIRSFLEKFGRTPQSLLKQQTVSHEENLVTAVISAVKYMAPRRIGGLIVIERTQTLQEYIATGISLDADISSQILINIFIPNTPLHDGAVIIRENKIASASSYLPLSDSSYIAKEFGTRHRAAIGLSEVSDAMTVVVSEETGGISLTYKDVFTHDMTWEELGDVLREKLVTPPETTNFWTTVIKGGR